MSAQAWQEEARRSWPWRRLAALCESSRGRFQFFIWTDVWACALAIDSKTGLRFFVCTITLLELARVGTPAAAARLGPVAAGSAHSRTPRTTSETTISHSLRVRIGALGSRSRTPRTISRHASPSRTNGHGSRRRWMKSSTCQPVKRRSRPQRRMKAERRTGRRRRFCRLRDDWPWRGHRLSSCQ